MEVDFEKIKQKKVKKFMSKHGLNTVAGFARFRAACYEADHDATYKKHTHSFIIENHIETVWHTYANIHPKEAWNGEMVSFGVQYSQKDNSINYLDDAYAGMEEGQIIILNLKLILGFLNIAVAHRVTEIDEQNRMIKLCYMESGASEGSQWINLHETPEGFTKVSHLTLYKSKSHFRDTKLYPRLHTKAISEFHLNVKKKAELVK